MTSNTYEETIQVRNQLSSQLKQRGVSGLIGVGIGNFGDDLCLVVSVDDVTESKNIPPSFGGFKVVVRDMGLLSLYGINSEDDW